MKKKTTTTRRGANRPRVSLDIHPHVIVCRDGMVTRFRYVAGPGSFSVDEVGRVLADGLRAQGFAVEISKFDADGREV